MPAPTPISGNARGEQAAASSPNSSPSPFNKIPILNSQSRSFFLFLVCGAAIIGLVVVFFLLGRGYLKPGETGLNPDSPAATVNGEVITVGEVERQVAIRKHFYENVYPEAGGEPISKEYIDKLDETVLGELINSEFIAQFSKGIGVDVTEDWVGGELEADVVKPEYNGDWQAYETYLNEKLHKTLADVYAGVRRDIQVRNILEHEKLNPNQFDHWLLELKKKSDIQISLQT